MAKQNLVNLLGQIQTAPVIDMSSSNDQPIRGVVCVKVLRRYFVNDNKSGMIYYDSPLVVSCNPEVIKKMALFKVGDMVLIKGVFTTKDIIKRSKCECGHVNERAAVFSFVTPIYVKVLAEELNQAEGEAYLKENEEISNSVIIMGNLCRDPKKVVTQNKTAICTYRIASNRKFNLKDGSPDEVTDYPSIRTFQNQAVQDELHLRQNSTILVDGAIQTRATVMNVTCDSCKQQYSYPEVAVEIVPYNVEYLRHCVFKTIDEEDKERFDED